MSRSGGWLQRGRLRARPDLVFVEQTADGAIVAESVVVKDPLSLQYFRLGEREHFLLRALREPLTVDQLRRLYQRRFPNEPTTGDRVLAFCAAMFESSLLVSDQAGQAEARQRLAGGAEPWWARALSPLAIRLPSFDPSPWLRPLNGFARALFSWPAIALLAIAATIVGVGLLGQADELLLEAGRLLELWRPSYALLAVAAVVVAKSWHELGHALACRARGAECHEMGVLLLALFPCLYCDVTDAWTLASRRARVAVALGGVYFEAMLAVAAGAAWLVLQDGPLRVLALYLVVVSSVSTLLVNLNPLLRFDGYYVLADAWGVANLHEQSRRALWGPVGRWVRGARDEEEPFDAPRWRLAIYGLASTIYVFALLAVILWGAHRVLSEAGFAAVGDTLVALSLVGVALAGVRSTARSLPRGPGANRLGGWARFATVVALAGGAVWWIGSMTIEQSLRSPFRLERAATYEVVARAAGTLEPLVAYGDTVEAGQHLAELIDRDAEMRRLELLEQEAGLTAELSGLRTRSQSDPALFTDVARAEVALAEAKRQRLTHEAEQRRRELRAPASGVVLRPADRPHDTESGLADGELSTWSGAPLDAPNSGCRLERGEIVCRVEEGLLQAVVLLDQTDSGLVTIGAPVRLALDRRPSPVLAGVVTAIAPAAKPADASSEAPAVEEALEASLRGSLEAGEAYRVTVELTDSATAAQPGAVGAARIVTGNESVAGWCLRWLRRLVRFA